MWSGGTTHTASIANYMLIARDPVTGVWSVNVSVWLVTPFAAGLSGLAVLQPGQNTASFDVAGTASFPQPLGPTPDTLEIVPFRWFQDTTPYSYY